MYAAHSATLDGLLTPSVCKSLIAIDESSVSHDPLPQLKLASNALKQGVQALQQAPDTDTTSSNAQRLRQWREGLQAARRVVDARIQSLGSSI